MNRKRITLWAPRLLVVAALAATGGALAAAPSSPMMSSKDMSEYGHPHHTDHSGYGHGPNSIGMMGNGLCGGGIGMMGGGMGMSPGKVMGPVAMLDLTNEQRDKIAKIYENERHKNWETYGKIMDEKAKLRDLYADETVDAKKVGTVYSNLAKLQQQVIEANVETNNRVQTVLTKEQKEQLRQWSHRGMGGRGMMGHGGREGYGPGQMPPGGGEMEPGMMTR